MVYWMLAKLIPVRLIAAVALVLIGLTYAGVDVTGFALDFLGIPSWSWEYLKPW
jgi:hypothetical protein